MAQAKYLQVKEDILKKIQIGKLCPMDMLPSENALCQEYSMSPVSYTHLDVYKRQIYSPAENLL